MGKMNAIDWVAFVLLIIGGLNWGLIGIFRFDLVNAVFGYYTVMSRLIYILVGLSAVYLIISAAMKSGRRT